MKTSYVWWIFVSIHTCCFVTFQLGEGSWSLFEFSQWEYIKKKKKLSKTQLSPESIQDSESGKPTNRTSIKFRKLNYQIRPWRLPYKVINWAHSCLIDNLQHFALFYVACSQRVGFVSYQRQHKIYKEVFRRLKSENGWWWHCCFGCGQWLRYV